VISCHTNILKSVHDNYIYHNNEKGKPSEKDLPLSKNDITRFILEMKHRVSGHRISGHRFSVHVELPVFQLLVETFQKLPIIEDIDRNYEIICLYSYFDNSRDA